MLTADLAMSWRRGRATGPRYIDPQDAGYLQVAGDLIAIFRSRVGSRRAELEGELDEYVGSGTDYKVLRGFIKLLTDRCAFETATTIEPSEIRRALFLKARSRHPITVDEREHIIRDVAEELNCPPDVITEGLYADLVANQRMVSFDEIPARELLDRYNVAQAQALLYRSVEMRVEVEPQDAAGYRRLFDAIKYYRLIHSVRGSAATGYEVRLSGPVSLFHRSQKYGIQMAVFLPALLRCRGWAMRAEIDLKDRGTAFFELKSDQSRLRADYDEEFIIENPFADKLAAKWDVSQSGWALERSNEVINLGGAVFIPDFVFHHTSGEKAYLEILGFWTPRYLAERLKAFGQAGFDNFILAASEEFRGSREGPADLLLNVILFKSSLDPRDVRAALARLTDADSRNK